MSNIKRLSKPLTVDFGGGGKDVFTILQVTTYESKLHPTAIVLFKDKDDGEETTISVNLEVYFPITEHSKESRHFFVKNEYGSLVKALQESPDFTQVMQDVPYGNFDATASLFEVNLSKLEDIGEESNG